MLFYPISGYFLSGKKGTLYSIFQRILEKEWLGWEHYWIHSYKQLSILFSAGANNLIPIEIALKIVNKIKANERFCAYIIIPMWPEGVPTSTPIQRILYWQVDCYSLFSFWCMQLSCLWLYCYIFFTWFYFDICSIKQCKWCMKWFIMP